MPTDAPPAGTRPSWLAPTTLRRVAQLVPSRRSLLIGAAVVAIAAGSYAIARETSLFAIDRVDVRGGSAAVDAQVTKALARFSGRSLIGLDGAAVLQRIVALPTVASATYDRAFPSTLSVRIVPERPVAVLRDGPAAWLVSERGRVIRPVVTTSAPTLPRIWIGEKTVRVGQVLLPRLGGTLTRVLTAVGSLRFRVGTASLANGQLVFHLRSGLELVLGSPANLALKVAVAEKVLQQLPAGTRSVDVSVPSRAVTSLYSSSS